MVLREARARGVQSKGRGSGAVLGWHPGPACSAWLLCPKGPSPCIFPSVPSSVSPSIYFLYLSGFFVSLYLWLAGPLSLSDSFPFLLLFSPPSESPPQRWKPFISRVSRAHGPAGTTWDWQGPRVSALSRSFCFPFLPARSIRPQGLLASTPNPRSRGGPPFTGAGRLTPSHTEGPLAWQTFGPRPLATKYPLYQPRGSTTSDSGFTWGRISVNCPPTFNNIQHISHRHASANEPTAPPSTPPS